MRKQLGIGALGVACAVMLAQAQQGDAARMAFETARKIESVDGDLRRAIAHYERAAIGSDRELAAQALLRITGSQGKLGQQAEAMATYDRLVREYADQAGALAAARAELADAPDANRDLKLRKVFDGAFIVGISPDGRNLVYHPSAANAVIMRDLSTGAERTLDAGETDFFESASFSHDGARLAYGRCGTVRDCEVRIVDLQAPKAVPRPVYSTTGVFVAPIDWSPDGKSIAVYVQRRDEQVLQLGLLHLSDGTLDVLQTTSWGGTLEGYFSRNGRDLAYSQRMDEDQGARDIFLMDVVSRRRNVLVTNPGDDFPLGWTPDGRHLIFGSDRSGAVGIWAQAVVDRKPVGAATLVHASIGGDVRAVGVTRAGTVVVGVRTFSQDVEVASFDPATGKATAAPVQIRTAADRTYLPAWSPDAQFLAYALVRNGRENVVGIRSMATGEERELHLAAQLDRVRSLTWTPDSQSLVGWGRDLRGRYGIFRIDATTGVASPVVFRDPPPVRQFVWSADGQRLWYGAQGGYFEYDGDVERRVDLLNGQPGVPSPDGRWIARLTGPDSASRSGSLIVQSMAGGSPRELHRFEAPARLIEFRWARDGRTLLAMHAGAGGAPELVMLPVHGAAPRRLDVDVSRIATNPTFLELSPDRRRIAYVAGDDRAEVWALENYLPLQ